MPDISKLAKGLTSFVKGAENAAPAVNRLDMNFKDVTKRIPELTDAANMVARGEMTGSQYDSLVRKLKPVAPYDFVPQPATSDDAMRALTENKRPMFGKTSEMTAGEQADLRLDIPAYKDHGVWVNSIHRKDQPTMYNATSSVKNATMIGAPDKALKVAQGGPKAPFAVIRGEWNPMDEAKAVKNAQKYLNHPDWKQVGYDPERHGFFYDRASMAPVVGADEVIQIGPLVLAKKPKYGKPEDFPFKKGGGTHMKTKQGAIRMQVGGLSALAKLGTAGTKLTKAEIASLRARGMGVPGTDFADPLKAPTMRMSEALGNVGAEGKFLNFTEADRSRVFAENMGGTGFTGLQNYSQPHKQARTVWGFGNQSTAEKKIRQNDPDNTIWTTYAGSPEQHKSNTVVVKDAVKTLQAANQAGTVNPEQIRLINQRIKQAKNDKGTPLFSDDFDITDPQAINAATTFERRTAISDALMGVGVKKPMISKEFKAANPNVKYSDASDISRILTRETDPVLANANTFDVGPHLFVMENKIIHRPDLNEAFPVQVTGDDLGMRFQPAPIRSAAPDFIKEKGYKPTDPINAWAMSRGNPRQFVDEKYLSGMQKEGYKDGGSAEPPPFHDFDQIMKRKDGGTVNTFEQRLKSALHMAMGGEVSDNTTPDMTDGGNINYGGQYARGGLTRRYAEAGSVPAPTPQELEKMADAQGAAFGVFPQMASQRFQQPSQTMDKASEMLKAQVTKEWEQAGRPGGAKGLSLRIGAVLAGQVPDIANLAQSVVPGLNKPASVLDPEGEKVARFPMSGTSTDIKNSMREKGIINEDEYPIAEMLGAFAAPYAAVKAPSAIKGGLNMAKPVVKEAGNMASRAAIPIQRPFTPATFTVESTADDLGQNTTYGFRQGVNDVLLGNPNLGTGKNKSREAVGTFMNPNEKINPNKEMEINPMRAIDVRRAGTLGDVPTANQALRQQVGQLGEDLNQTSMAGHRFLPLMTNNIKDASSMLIKTQQGLSKDEIKQLATLLGNDMVLTHNPKLGGVVVMPFGRVEKGQIPEEFLKAQSAAGEVLGKRGKVQFGVSDYDKDRLFMEKSAGDYTKAGAKPMSKEQQATREKMQGLEKFLFPESRSGIPGQVKAAPVGGLQPWSVGADYPTSVIGIGNGSKVQYQPRNFSTGKQGSRYDTYMDAEQERAQMLDEFHRTLVPKYR